MLGNMNFGRAHLVAGERRSLMVATDNQVTVDHATRLVHQRPCTSHIGYKVAVGIPAPNNGQGFTFTKVRKGSNHGLLN